MKTVHLNCLIDTSLIARDDQILKMVHDMLKRVLDLNRDSLLTESHFCIKLHLPEQSHVLSLTILAEFRLSVQML